MTSEQRAAYDRGEAVELTPGNWIAKYQPVTEAELAEKLRAALSHMEFVPPIDDPEPNVIVEKPAR